MERGLMYTVKLSVGYGAPLIRDISIDVRKGEILTLIGPNGAGKSTILKSIAGRLVPKAGTVYIDGKRLNEIKGVELSRRLAVLMTDRAKPEYMSCFDVAAVGRYPYTGRMGVLSVHDRECVQEALELVQAEKLSEHDFNKISDGQKQLVLLARAVCQQPDVLVLDEPTSFLDIRYKQLLLETLKKLVKEKQIAVIMSMHETDLAQKVSDKIICVKDGRIDRCGVPEEIFTGRNIEELYGLETGSYNVYSGFEFGAVKGTPEVFVIGGNGTGIPEYRKLRRTGIPFAAGVLHENDIDYPIAKALAAETVTEKAYFPISESAVERAKALIDVCGRVICSLDSFGPLNEMNRLLSEYAGSKLSK